MEGTIFIRGNQITIEQENILAAFKVEYSISANTKAIQALIMKYDDLKKQVELLKKENKKLIENNFDLNENMREYKDYFQKLKKIINND